mmetsp:Transcript_34858/g.81454  ORF Transcript_34858/g.81454 Transcript_34858/m.81454 type:complete len:233 (+) Transcript_34858:478-1176(+)
MLLSYRRSKVKPSFKFAASLTKVEVVTPLIRTAMSDPTCSTVHNGGVPSPSSRGVSARMHAMARKRICKGSISLARTNLCQNFAKRGPWRTQKTAMVTKMEITKPMVLFQVSFAISDLCPSITSRADRRQTIMRQCAVSIFSCSPKISCAKQEAKETNFPFALFLLNRDVRASVHIAQPFCASSAKDTILAGFAGVPGVNSPCAPTSSARRKKNDADTPIGKVLALAAASSA